MSKTFPPNTLADLPKSSVSSFVSLVKAMREQSYSIVLGAGVSASAGLPPWTTLVHRIASTYFTHWEFNKNLGNANSATPPNRLSIAFWNDFLWSDEAKTAASMLVDRQDALRAAQMIKARVRQADWIYLVRKALYGDNVLPPPSALLRALGNVCSKLAPDVEILSYNYDNLLEQTFYEQIIKFTSIWGPERRVAPGTIPIYYPHGYLKHGGGPKVPLVLGEDDYHQYAVDQYGWNNAVQLRQFSRSTCMFVGFSLTDPQVSRLLWVAKRGGAGQHYALLPSATGKNSSDGMVEALFDAQLRDVNINVVRYPAGSDGRDHTRLSELVSLLGDALDNPDVVWQ